MGGVMESDFTWKGTRLRDMNRAHLLATANEMAILVARLAGKQNNAMAQGDGYRIPMPPDGILPPPPPPPTVGSAVMKVSPVSVDGIPF